MWGRMHPQLAERFHPDLHGKGDITHLPERPATKLRSVPGCAQMGNVPFSPEVHAWTAGLVAFELAARLKKRSGWPLVMERNRWFQRKVVAWMEGKEQGGREQGRREEGPHPSPLPAGEGTYLHPSSLIPHPSSFIAPVLFAYSYAALEPFRVAKARGWRTVLGQIDPGPAEERIVAELLAGKGDRPHLARPVKGTVPFLLAQKSGQSPFSGGWQPAPREYWDKWREECELADTIMVNSQWSRQALSERGRAGGEDRGRAAGV